MEIQGYLDQIIFWVGSALAALGGTGISLGLLFKWVKDTLAQLFAGKKEFEEKAHQLDFLSQKLESTGETMVTLAENIDGFKSMLDDATTRDTALAKAISLLANNIPSLVNNGIASQIDEILGLKEDEVASEEVSENEITD